MYLVLILNFKCDLSGHPKRVRGKGRDVRRISFLKSYKHRTCQMIMLLVRVYVDNKYTLKLSGRGRTFNHKHNCHITRVQCRTTTSARNQRDRMDAYIRVARTFDTTRQQEIEVDTYLL